METDDELCGVLPAQAINDLLDSGGVKWRDHRDCRRYVKPASLDLPLLAAQLREIDEFRIPQPGQPVAAAYPDAVPVADGVMRPGRLYLLPAQFDLQLPAHVAAECSPKSTTGRLGVKTWVLGDGHPGVNAFPAGYGGRLYTVTMPLHFPVDMQCAAGDRIALNQCRFAAGSRRDYHSHSAILTVHTKSRKGAVVGYRAVNDPAAPPVNPHTGSMPIFHYPNAAGANRHFEPIYSAAELRLQPGHTYILGSDNAVEVPAGLCGQMVDYDSSIGDFLAHMAGFFDPGFGVGRKTRAVFEITGLAAPMTVWHGQPLGRIEYERMAAAPAVLYGGRIGSHYQHQGVRPARCFKIID